MRRSGLHCAARVRHQHMGLLMYRRKENNMQKCHICSSPPGIREHGSLSFGKPLSQLSLVFQGSKDFNPRSATPSDVRGNRRIIISLCRSWRSSFRCFFSRMDRSVQSRPSCWVLIVRHGASLITLPALGTCLRAGYSVVKVRSDYSDQAKSFRILWNISRSWAVTLFRFLRIASA